MIYFKEKNIANENPCEVSWFDKNGELHSSILCASNGWLFKNGKYYSETLKLSLKVEIHKSSTKIHVSVPQSELIEWGDNRFESIVLLPGFISGTEDDGSSIVVPYDNGFLCHSREKECAEYIIPGFFCDEFQPYMVNMMLTGIIKRDCVVGAIIDKGKFDVEFRLRTNYGAEHIYSIDPVFKLRDFADEEIINESPTVIYRLLDGGLEAMAKWYREYIIKKQNIPTLAEKIKKDPRIEYAAKALSVRMRLACKPVPSPILEQTKDNQPPLKVYMTFDNVATIADEFARQKIGPVDFTYVGWNYAGHDGAFPQLFPVEEAVGGKVAMLNATRHIQSLGYQVGVHDNYIDMYSLADNFDRSNIMIKHDGEEESGDAWGGGLAYICCPEQAMKIYAEENLRKMKSFGFDGAYYVDVISLIDMKKCYSKNHPISRRENSECYKSILKMQREVTGISMSEGVRDWAFPELDRTLAVSFDSEAPKLLAYIDEEIPLYPMIFHGLLIYNSFRIGINALPGEELYLRNFAYGGIPQLYYHFLFQDRTVAPEDKNHCNDFMFGSLEQLAEDTKIVKRISNDMAKTAHLQKIFIKDFIKLSPTLTQTIYEDGSSVYVNYGDTAVQIPNEQIVPGKDFLVTCAKKTDYVSKRIPGVTELCAECS